MAYIQFVAGAYGADAFIDILKQCGVPGTSESTPMALKMSPGSPVGNIVFPSVIVRSHKGAINMVADALQNALDGKGA